MVRQLKEKIREKKILGKIICQRFHENLQPIWEFVREFEPDPYPKAWGRKILKVHSKAVEGLGTI